MLQKIRRGLKVALDIGRDVTLATIKSPLILTLPGIPIVTQFKDKSEGAPWNYKKAVC